VKLNELENVKCFNYAIWQRDGFLSLYEDELLVSSSTIKKSYGPIQKRFIVRAISMDQLIKQNILPQYIDIAKLDIEGSEIEFLEGGIQSLSRGCINRLVVEVHKNKINLKEFYDKLKALYFKVVHKVTYYESDIIYAIHVK
jgi:FkbM family methyltransferase